MIVFLCGYLAEFNKMKDELPKGYSIPPGRSDWDHSKTEYTSIHAVSSNGMEKNPNMPLGEAISMEEEGQLGAVLAPPNERNVDAAAATALACAAVKDKVSFFLLSSVYTHNIINAIYIYSYK